MEERIKLAIADDHYLIAETLSRTLPQKLPCDIVFQAHNGEELIRELATQPVDIILLDINMPVMSGIEALEIIKRDNPNQKIIVLSMYNDDAFILDLIKRKANSVMSKLGGVDEICKAIQEVAIQGRYFSERMTEVLYNDAVEIQSESADGATYVNLSSLDKKILRMMCNEQTSKEIAANICLSYRTIEGRRKRMISNLGVRSQAGLILYAIRNGIYKL